MAVPKVAIVGRPNVGKSSLLNWLTRKRISVVDPAAGVTRDRVTFLLHEHGRWFELVDTGGIGIVDSDDLTEDVERQIDRGITEASVVMFVVDGKAGVVPLDIEVGRRLRSVSKPALLVVNKCDSPKQDLEVAEFHRITSAPHICTSVLAERNRDALIKAIVNALPPADADENELGEAQAAEPELKLAIVGRRNVGKSTFINALAQTERMIVSEVPGTTRDSVDVRFELDGKRFMAIDTPGVRKRKSLANDVEFYGLVRAKRSIRRADVVFMFFDATQTVSKVDKQLVEEIHDNYKPCIFVINKWDLSKNTPMTTEKWTKYLSQTFASMRHVPIAYITAREDRNTKQLINLAQSIFKQARHRVSTAEVNQVIRHALTRNPPSSATGKRLKIYYGTQVAAEPPTIVLKCNHPEQFDNTWRRYLLGVLREHLPFKEVPIKLYLRTRTGATHDPSIEELTDEATVELEADIDAVERPTRRKRRSK
ncbi:MAG TPA: ribosome biogenesis GTPase Der [Planctomycetaceae bacterium]|nr:ribosome biogenesis GTPase Der [Planctomycetaceae bacterium]